MSKAFPLLAALCAIGVAVPAAANVVRELSFEEMMARADLVVIASVTAIDERERTATLAILHTLKGEARATATVITYSNVAELDPQCCVTAATYIMFLGRTGVPGRFGSVWGAQGMVRLGAPPGYDLATGRPDGD